MAVDTRSKRASALQGLRPFGLALVGPDGTLGQGDRQHTAWCYAGTGTTYDSVGPDLRSARSFVPHLRGAFEISE